MTMRRLQLEYLVIALLHLATQGIEAVVDTAQAAAVGQITVGVMHHRAGAGIHGAGGVGQLCWFRWFDRLRLV